MLDYKEEELKLNPDLSIHIAQAGLTDHSRE
jgi:hypothetical protein